jgi:phenylalanyl-tRNA synthetase beta subunit
MNISYKWLKTYVADLPEPDKLWDVFTYHLCEVEEMNELSNGDTIFDVNILPDRAHYLLSHQGIARELASLLDLKFKESEFKTPDAKSTDLKINIESEDCRRYMGRIVRNVEVGESPKWVKDYLESIGERSINSVVDAANIVMYDSGQPIHCFDLDKLNGPITIRQAREGEEMTTLDDKHVELRESNMVIADDEKVLAIAGVKGGKAAEVDENTKNIVIEVANFDPVSVRKTARGIHIFTDAAKRFENELSAELCEFAMREITGLLMEVACPERPKGVEWEEVVDEYPLKPEEHSLTFRTEKVSKVLGLDVTNEQIEDILKRYNFEYESKRGEYTIRVPHMRFDLRIEEDMAEEIGRVLGYDKVELTIPKINFKPQVNDTHAKITWARKKLLEGGYSEVMTYTFRSKGEVKVLKSASDKKALRTNLSDGLLEAVAWNSNLLPLLGISKFPDLKIFEIGTVFFNDHEEIHVAFNNKEQITEMTLDEFCKEASPDALAQVLGCSSETHPDHSPEHTPSAFAMWSLYPFISRDIALWVPEGVGVEEVQNVIKSEMEELVVRGPELFDEFHKEGRVSYAFRLVFQSFERTLTDVEVGEIMDKITLKLKANSGWEIR